MCVRQDDLMVRHVMVTVEVVELTSRLAERIKLFGARGERVACRAAR